MVSKIPADVSLFSGTSVRVTTEQRIPRKRNRKSPAMLPPITDQIPDQYSIIIINEQVPILPELVAKYPTGYRPFLYDVHYSNKTEDKSIILQIIYVLRLMII